MNDLIKQHNIKLADELGDGHYESYGLLYRVNGEVAVIAWGISENSITGSCIMTVKTSELKKTIVESDVQRSMNPITAEDYNKRLNNILNTIL